MKPMNPLPFVSSATESLSPRIGPNQTMLLDQSVNWFENAQRGQGRDIKNRRVDRPREIKLDHEDYSALWGTTVLRIRTQEFPRGPICLNPSLSNIPGVPNQRHSATAVIFLETTG